jgi:hypothetical protein
MTDIANPGTYEVRDNQVLLTLRSVEVTRELTFTFSPDERTLRLEQSGTVWVWEKKTSDPSDSDTLICDAKDKQKQLHVKVTPFKDQGAKCGEKLEFYLNEKQLEGEWHCQGDAFRDTWSQIYKRSQGDTVLIYDPQQGYQLARFIIGDAHFYPMDCHWE